MVCTEAAYISDGGCLRQGLESGIYNYLSIAGFLSNCLK